MQQTSNVTAGRFGFRTTCGRQITIGRIALGGPPEHPISRVTISIGACPDCQGETWAALTVTEAHLLAGALLDQAAAVTSTPQPTKAQLTPR